METGSIESDSLFLGLTRPPLLLGVSYHLAALNLLFSLLTFIITNNFFYILVILPAIHGICWMICLKEPKAVELLITKSSLCNICPNKVYYKGANSYDIY